MSEKCIKITERKNDTHAVNVPINRMSDSVNKCGKHLPKKKKKKKHVSCNTTLCLYGVSGLFLAP